MSEKPPSVISRIAEGKPSQSSQSKLWGGVAFLCGLAIWFAVSRFEPQVVAEAAGYSTTVIVFTGWVFWSGLRRRWYWAFMATVVAVHGVVLCTVPWPAHFETSKRDMIFLFGDFILMLGFGALVAQLTGKPDGNA